MAAAAVPAGKPAKITKWDAFAIMRALPELAAGEKLSGLGEMAFLVVLLNATVAKTRKPKTPAPAEARFSHSQIARAIGFKGKNVSDTVQRMVMRLKKAGIIAVRKEGKDQVLWYRLTPARWDAAPKYEPPPLKLVKLPVIVEEADDEADDDPPAEGATPQLALVGMEHLAVATAQARAIKLDTPASEVSFLNQLPVSVDISRRRAGGRLQFVLRSAGTPDLQVGGHNSGYGVGTPDLQVGGQKSSHKAMVAALCADMSKRGFALAPDFARLALAAMGWPDVDFALNKIDDSIARCKAKRERFLPAWLKTTLARDIKATWPDEKKARAAAAAEAERREASARVAAEAWRAEDAAFRARVEAFMASAEFEPLVKKQMLALKRLGLTADMLRRRAEGEVVAEWRESAGLR